MVSGCCLIFLFYLEQHAQEVDFAKIHRWCQQSHILHLYESVLETCRIYLNLPEMIDPDVHYDLSDCDAFLSRILEDGDLGADVSQELVGSHSYKKVNLLTYFREGHLQMKVRFPKAGRCPLLWPMLWPITFFCFLEKYLYAPKHHLPGNIAAIQKKQSEDTADPYF